MDTFTHQDKISALTPEDLEAILLSGNRPGNLILPETSYDTVLSLAGALRRHCASSGLSSNDVLCVATTQRLILAASTLSALAGGPKLVLPYSLTNNAIMAACQALNARCILTARGADIPEGFNIFLAEELEPGSPVLSLDRSPNDPFVYLFTGGSTGKPAVWSKTPINLFGEALFLRDWYHVKPSDVIVAAVPPYHIYGLLYSVLLPLVAKCSVLGESPFFPNEILAVLEAWRATILAAAPMHYKSLAESNSTLKNLRLAISGGGFLEDVYVEHFWRHSGIEVSNNYGSTEAGGIAIHHWDGGKQSWQPYSVVRCRLLDDGMLAVNSPFLSQNLQRDQEGYFLTGDRVEPEGADRFVLKGRADGIVKVGAKRVDLAEVEAAIRAIPEVKDAYVVALPTPEGRENLIAALVVTKLAVEEVHRLLEGRLEAVAFPRRMVRVDEIPTSAVGKRDRVAALAALGYSQTEK